MLSSKKNEKKIIALLMTEPTHMRALNLDLDMFASAAHKDAAKLIQQYVTKYKSPPSVDTLSTFANTLAGGNIKLAEQYTTALDVVKSLPAVPATDAEFEFARARNFKVGRSLFDLSQHIKDKFENGDTNYVAMRQEIIADLLASGNDSAERNRGMVYSRVEQRWKEYINTSKNEVSDVIPFGMSGLDDELGGLRKTFVTLMYSKTGGGKTRTAVNIAYNAAEAGYNVMYFSLEMSFNLLATCFDSRMGWIDSNKIIFGKLDDEGKKKYKIALQAQLKEKLNIWIVDVSMGARSSIILEEIELYKASRGVAPDLVIVDYANIMEPVKRYSDRSTKYDNLFQEFHEIAKYANIHLLTMTQESRDASLADINSKNSKKNAEAEQGVHNIGLSNFMAPHCDTVIRLKQDKTDQLHNKIWAIVDKHRSGKTGVAIPLTAIWDKNYVGNSVVSPLKIKRSVPLYEDK